MESFLQLFFLSLAIRALGQDTSPSGPSQPGTASNCNKWYTVKSGDGCYSVETAFGITHTQFLAWNPAVSDDCTTNFWLGYSYCIGVSSTVASSSSSIIGTTTTPVTSSSAPITTTASVNATYSIRNPVTSYNLSTPTTDRTWPPTKTQAGQPSYCNKWYLIEAGDTCEIIYRKFGTSMSRENLYVVSANGASGQSFATIDTDCKRLKIDLPGIRPWTAIAQGYTMAGGSA